MIKAKTYKKKDIVKVSAKATKGEYIHEITAILMMADRKYHDDIRDLLMFFLEKTKGGENNDN